MKSYTVYRWRNRLNGKCYIGITTVPDKRKQQHICGYRATSWISQAIQKHGIENFDYDELESGLNEDAALQRERELIFETNSYESGYNQTPGGYHITGPRPGENHHNAVLTEDAAIKIINDPCSGIDAVKKYGVSRGIIHNVRVGNTWTHLDRSDAPNRADSRKKLTDDDVKAIFLDTRSQPVIAKNYDVDQSTVSNIKRRKRGKAITESLLEPKPKSQQYKPLRFSVFRLLNTVNGRCFVGMSAEPKKRMSQMLSGHGGSKSFKNDLLSYGKHVFIRQIIESHENETEANRRMQTFIMRHVALHPSGYNMGIGGKGSHGHIWSIEQRAKVAGSNNNRSKLTESQVKEIFEDSRSRTRIAKCYSISTTMVTKIKNKQAWKHVTQWLCQPSDGTDEAPS